MQIILNADDFGCSASINEAVMLAHRQGVLTSTSLAITGDAAQEAVTMAWETPTLAVGLHVVVADGKSALPPSQIPHLVDRNGRFSADPILLGLRYFFSPTARQELARELEAQLERFSTTGLPLSHVDSHLHMHVIPTVFDLLMPLAERYGAQGLRLPRDDFWLAMAYDRRSAALKATWALIFGMLCRRCLRRLRGHQLAFTHRVYGVMQTGRMLETYVLGLLRRIRVPSAELYFHPSADPQSESLGPNPGDLTTLLSPAVRQVIQERGLQLATYPTLERSKPKC